MAQKRQAYFNNMAMLTLSRAVLLVSIWTGDVVRYANALKEGTKLLVLASPICLHSTYFPIKHMLNKMLKIMELLKHFRFMMKQIYPCKRTIIINKANIKIVFANKSWSRTPYIREYQIKRSTRHTRRPRIGELVALALLTSVTHGFFIGLLHEGQLIFAKDLMND